jgi:hypothetical protein
VTFVGFLILRADGRHKALLRLPLLQQSKSVL